MLNWLDPTQWLRFLCKLVAELSCDFNDLRIVNPNFRIDPNLEDEKGYNMDLGIRGSYQGIRFDMTAYYLRYANRIGFCCKSTLNCSLPIVFEVILAK